MQNMMSFERRGFCQFLFEHNYLLIVSMCTADSEMFTPLIAVQFMPCF